jgi:hypothetical protein
MSFNLQFLSDKFAHTQKPKTQAECIIWHLYFQRFLGKAPCNPNPPPQPPPPVGGGKSLPHLPSLFFAVRFGQQPFAGQQIQGQG